MQILQIKPSNQITFKIPSGLRQKFTIGNLTLRSVCIFIISSHPEAISITPQTYLIEAFQEVQIFVLLHWTQSYYRTFKGKLRVYIWQSFEDQSIEQLTHKMFNKETDGNCLMFEELNIDCHFDHNALLRTHATTPLMYFIRRVQLPNQDSVLITQQTIDKLFAHCEKIKKIKSIYNMGQHFIIEFTHVEEPLCSFCQLRDFNDNLCIFCIGCLPELGTTACSPDYILMNKQNQQKTKKQEKYRRKQSGTSGTSGEGISQDKTDRISEEEERKDVVKQTIFQKIKNKKKQLFTKQSFIHEPQSMNKKRRRNRSQETIKIDISQIDEDENENENWDKFGTVERLRDFRIAQTFQTKVKEFSETMLDLGKKILNYEVSQERNRIYILFRDSVVICPLNNLLQKTVLKFDPIDQENTNLPTPMLLLEEDQTIIFGNETYLFWVSLNGAFKSDWKYVQRKQIYALQVISELNLLVVGGKNFSKLSYLGKSTSRTNLKIYSCGKTGKRDHLFTFDIPNCDGENIIDLNYVNTKPIGTKLLVAVTSGNKLLFLRVRAFNEIQVFSMMEGQEIGIQQFIRMKNYRDSSVLVCLEKLDENNRCFKFLKVTCSYEKVQVSTESLKFPVGPYIADFRLGGEQNARWIAAVTSDGSIWSMNFEWNEAEQSKGNVGVKSYYVLNNGCIYKYQTGFKFSLLKQ